ncbi:MAG TPA: SGNH/GDSL hydrolase family protein [Vicinamibacterales bacterium]|nr:SGNH/GDSL hydrolase family protein [Vicinamibacterales bacterium]
MLQTATRTNRRTLIALVLLFQLLVGVVLVEVALVTIFAHPSSRYPPALLEFLRWEYFYRRSVVQLDEGRARYDPELLYTLRPGRFTFANIEYSTPYAVNSLGVRDDEAALAHPEIVVAGDSYAMGWGVQQDEAFPQVIRGKTGRRVLNAAVSSYGTVREMRLLDRVDMSQATTLVIQYCSNDFDENDQFEEHGNRHVPSREQEWLQAIASQQRTAHYRPFRMLYDSAVWIKRGIEGHRWGGFEFFPPPAERAAERFLNAVIYAPHQDLTRLRILVTDPEPDPRFIRALDRLHRDPKYPPYIRTMQIVDVSALMTPDVRYVLDDHPNARGQRLIAEALIAAMRPGCCIEDSPPGQR